MIRLIWFVLAVLASLFKSKIRLEAENAALRHQLIVLRRTLRGRVRFTNHDRWFFVQLYRWFPSILTVLTIIRPATLVRWHRAGFRCYWRWKSRRRGGRPQIEADLRALIRRMSVENPLWGSPRIHGELLKLGFAVAQSSVAKYMVKRRGPPSQGWRTFLHNHAPDIAAMDLFVVPTIGFDLLYALIIVRLDRRGLVWINVTTNPTAEWIARQLTEAFPWDEAPHYLIRDRDQIYGAIVTRRLRAMGIRDKPTAPASPWQNGFAERLIGSIRRECVDHFIVLGEAHLRRILRSYARYYNDIRTHRSLDKDAPVSRPVQRTGVITSNPILGGLHRHYVRVSFSVHTATSTRSSAPSRSATRPSESSAARISSKLPLRANRSRTEMIVVLYANGAPDTIRTCGLRLRRAKANQPCSPPPTEIEGWASIWMSRDGLKRLHAKRHFRP
jgi:transposase InsO family protein